MSWDVLFQNLPEGVQDLEAIPEDFQPGPLCTREDYEKMVFTLFPSIDRNQDRAWMILEGDGFSIEFNADQDDPLESLMLHVRGGVGALDAIRKICEYTGWKAIDTSSGGFIDFAKNPDEGFGQWRDFRDRVVAKVREEGRLEAPSQTPDTPTGKEFLVSVRDDGSLHVIKKGFQFKALVLGPFFVYSELSHLAGFVLGIGYCLVLSPAYGHGIDPGRLASSIWPLLLVNLLLAIFAYPLKLRWLEISSARFTKSFASDEETATLEADRKLRT